MKNTQSIDELLKRFASPNEHHPLGPSAASRWMICPASVRETIDLPNTSSSAAEEGTKAHAEAERCLINGVESDDEYVNDYIDYVKSLDGKQWYEQKIDLTDMIPHGYGTADAVVYNDGVLHIVDLKYGKGVKVYADSLQLQLYAVGVHQAFIKKNMPVTAIKCHIVQPRLNHIDVYDFDVTKVDDFIANVSIAVTKCLEPDAPYNPTEHGCQWCKVQATCQALYNKSLETIGDDFTPIKPEELTDDQLSLVMNNKSLIEKWLRSVEGYIIDKLNRGGTFNGWKMVEGRSIRKFTDDAEQLLSEKYGDAVFTKKLKNLTEIEKMVGKKEFAVLNCVHKPKGSPTLVKESDPRPALENILNDFKEI